MPEAIIKAKAPSFYGSKSSTPKTPASGSNLQKHWPWIAALVLAGVAIVFFLRSRSLSSSANVGPALTIYPDTSADESGLANAIQAATALGNIQRGAGNGGDTTVTGGGSTHVTPDNTNTSPGTTPISTGTQTTSGQPFVSSQNAGAYDAVRQQLIDAGLIVNKGGYYYFDTANIGRLTPAQNAAAGAVGILGTPGAYAGADYSQFTGLVGKVGGRTGNGYTYYVNGQPVATAPLGTTDPAAWAQQQAERKQVQ